MIVPYEPYEIPQENPCKGCTDRIKNCHANCFDHLIYSVLQELEQEEQKRKKDTERYINKKKYQRKMIYDRAVEGGFYD